MFHDLRLNCLISLSYFLQQSDYLWKTVSSIKNESDKIEQTDIEAILSPTGYKLSTNKKQDNIQSSEDHLQITSIDLPRKELQVATLEVRRLFVRPKKQFSSRRFCRTSKKESPRARVGKSRISPPHK